MYIIQNNIWHETVHLDKKQVLNPHQQKFVSIFFQIVMQRHPTGFGFTLMGSSPVCVVKVKRDSSAATAGLALGDYITNVNGQDVSRLSAESVAAIIR